jgi:PAS domain S-box-containing protein
VSKIMIVDGQPMMRYAIRLIAEASGHQVIAETDSGVDAVHLARLHTPDLLIIELAVPRLGGLEVIHRIKMQSKMVKILVFTAQDSDYFAIRCREASATGFLSKNESLDALKDAIQATLDGRAYFPSQAILNATHKNSSQQDEPLGELSGRELSVLRLLTKGLSNIEIANELMLSDKTVSTYKTRMMRKLNASSLLELIDISRKHHLIAGQTTEAEAAAPLDETQQSELELLRKIIDAMPHSLAVRDCEGRVTMCNQQYLILTQSTLDEVLGGKIDELKELPPKERADLHAAFMAAMSQRKPYSRDVVVNFHGIRHVLRHWGRPYFDKQGQYLGMICGNVDITDRDTALLDLLDAYEHAEVANRAKDSFLNAIGSELVEPLHSAAAELDRALNSPEPIHWKKPITNVRASVESLLSIIDDLRLLNQLDSGEIAVSPKVMDLMTVVEQCFAKYHGAALAKGLHFELSTTFARHPKVWCDPYFVEQILDKLLSNAIRFTEHGTIKLQLSANDRGQGITEVELQVEDSGIGVARNKQPLLFEPFAQFLDDARPYGHSGLGLALCKRLAETISGKISVESHLGHGTTVVVMLRLQNLRSDIYMVPPLKETLTRRSVTPNRYTN